MRIIVAQKQEKSKSYTMKKAKYIHNEIDISPTI